MLHIELLEKIKKQMKFEHSVNGNFFDTFQIKFFLSIARGIYFSSDST